MKTDRNVVIDQMNWADYCDALRSEHYAGALTRFEGRNDVRKVLKKASVEQDRDEEMRSIGLWSYCQAER